ncbi:MAG: ELM1/GtrOC1 family putative glycosyltransferase [Candidatus Omnitrophota bacterium]
MLRFIDYIAAIFVRTINLIFHILPIGLILWLGRQAGKLVYFFNTERRVIAYANLKAAFCMDKTPQQIRKITKGVYINLLQTFFEILALTKVDKKYIDKYIELVNVDDKYRIIDHKNGAIFLTAHFGNWELSGIVSSIKGYPLVVLAREQKMKKLNELINRLRESKGSKVIRKGITVRYIVNALREGKLIGMVGDQDAGKTGEFADFFGRPASTASGTMRIAASTKAFVLPVFIARIKGPYHKLILEEPFKVEEGEDVASYIEKYNKLLEKYVRKYPENYLWLHRRWKSTPLKKVLLLSDGKIGHINQSIAFSNLLKRYREDSGCKHEDTQIETVEVKFKNRFTKKLLNLISIFSSKRCQGCMKCVKFCLSKETYDNLIHRYVDVVVSAGSGLAGLNRMLSIENNAKNAHIMKPSILGHKKFNMVVLPKHDGKDVGEGAVITTETMLNLVDEEYLERSRKEMSKTANFGKEKKIGVLLGGNSSRFVLTKETARVVLDGIIDASKKIDADILLTTSRRTPKSVAEYVKKRLKLEKRCKLLVLADEKNSSKGLGGILAFSDVLAVSGDSASMISEAVSSGKPIIVFTLKRKYPGRTKFDKMLEFLKNKERINVVDPQNLSFAIQSAICAGKRQSISEDNFNVYKYMWRLL